MHHRKDNDGYDNQYWNNGKYPSYDEFSHIVLSLLAIQKKQKAHNASFDTPLYAQQLSFFFLFFLLL